MERLILKEDVVKAIKTDQMLYGKVAIALGVSISSMRRILDANKPDLAQASVLRVLRDHLGKKKDSDLLTIMQEPKKVAIA